MKKVLFVCALMVSAMVMAQGPKCQHHAKPDCKGNACMSKMACPQTMAINKAMEYRDVLRLTEKQFNKMYKVYLDEFTAMKSDSTFCCKDKKEMTKEQCEAMKAKMQAKMDNRKAKMKKVLDDAQFALWLTMEKPKCCHHACPKHQGFPPMHKELPPMHKDSVK
ncbi:MAG: hypothetical protein MJZ65_01060 [Paludibacteraceae bacterium]|nr:hypothetical protein [Paludibacteraceae bacterium]